MGLWLEAGGGEDDGVGEGGEGGREEAGRRISWGTFGSERMVVMFEKERLVNDSQGDVAFSKRGMVMELEVGKVKHDKVRLASVCPRALNEQELEKFTGREHLQHQSQAQETLPIKQTNDINTPTEEIQTRIPKNPPHPQNSAQQQIRYKPIVKELPTLKTTPKPQNSSPKP